jgi:hypothetical protein
MQKLLKAFRRNDRSSSVAQPGGLAQGHARQRVSDGVQPQAPSQPGGPAQAVGGNPRPRGSFLPRDPEGKSSAPPILDSELPAPVGAVRSSDKAFARLVQGMQREVDKDGVEHDAFLDLTSVHSLSYHSVLAAANRSDSYALVRDKARALGATAAFYVTWASCRPHAANSGRSWPRHAELQHRERRRAQLSDTDRVMAYLQDHLQTLRLDSRLDKEGIELEELANCYLDECLVTCPGATKQSAGFDAVDFRPLHKLLTEKFGLESATQLVWNLSNDERVRHAGEVGTGDFVLLPIFMGSVASQLARAPI